MATFAPPAGQSEHPKQSEAWGKIVTPFLLQLKLEDWQSIAPCECQRLNGFSRTVLIIQIFSKIVNCPLTCYSKNIIIFIALHERNASM